MRIFSAAPRLSAAILFAAFAGALSIVLALSISPAKAGTVSLDPMITTLGAGDTFDMDIRFSGDTNLTVTSQMNIDFRYNPTVITPFTATYGSFFTDTSPSATGSMTISPINAIVEFVNVQISSMSLFATTLVDELFATISFQAVAPGFTLIEHVGGGQGGCCAGDGFFSMSLDAPAEVTVIDPIPLPAAFPLFGTGLGILGFIGWRRRRKVAQAV